MFAEIAGKYDFMNDVLSFGIHHSWRRKSVKRSNTRPGMSIIDCCCGTGDFSIAYNKYLKGDCKIVGVDFVQEMLDLATEKTTKLRENENNGLDYKNIEFEQADIMKMDFPDDRFDLGCISFGIRNIPKPLECLIEMSRVVRSGGELVILELGQPVGLFSLIYKFYSKFIMPPLGWLLTGNRKAYIYLPVSAERFPSRQKFIDIMNKTGKLTNCRYYPLTFGIAYVYIGEVV